MKTLEFLLMPSFDLIRESNGIEEDEDYNTDAILFQQGYEGEYITVEDGDEFEIPEEYFGRIMSEEDIYIIDDEKDLENKNEFLLEGDLTAGRYKFEAKEQVIISLESDNSWL